MRSRIWWFSAHLTGATVTLTTGARRVFCTFTANYMATGAANAVIFNLAVDGSLQLGTQGFYQQALYTSTYYPVSFSYVTAPLSAGSHTFKIQWYVTSQTGNVIAGSANTAHFGCYEIA